MSSYTQANQTSGAPTTQGQNEGFVNYSGPTSTSAGSSIPATTSKLTCDHKDGLASGHNNQFAKFDINGPNVIHHDNIYLKPVTKTTVRHIEIEEIERVTTIDRHIHHIQYHFQNVIKPEVEVRDSHSYYELVDPRLNITQSEPVFHAPIEHKLKYQPVSRDEFMDQQTAIRPGSEIDHFEEHISIGGVGRPVPNVTTGATQTSQGLSQGSTYTVPATSGSHGRSSSTSATPNRLVPSSGPPQAGTAY